MQVIEVVYKSLLGVDSVYFESNERYQEWRENYPEYPVLEVLPQLVDPVQLTEEREQHILENVASIKEVALQLLYTEDSKLCDLANVLSDRCTDIEIAISYPNVDINLYIEDDAIDLDSLKQLLGEK